MCRWQPCFGAPGGVVPTRGEYSAGDDVSGLERWFIECLRCREMRRCKVKRIFNLKSVVTTR